MKTVGLILLLAVGTAGGMLAAARLRQRVTLLRQTARLLERIAGQIRIGDQPLRPLLDGLCREKGLPPYLPELCQAMHGGRSPAEAFDGILRRQDLPYTATDRELLRHCTDTIGSLDREGQLQQLTQSAQQMEQQLRQAHEKAESRGRVYQMLGTCAGAALVLLLW